LASKVQLTIDLFAENQSSSLSGASAACEMNYHTVLTAD
jgi:hypothetical protein